MKTLNAHCRKCGDDIQVTTGSQHQKVDKALGELEKAIVESINEHLDAKLKEMPETLFANGFRQGKQAVLDFIETEKDRLRAEGNFGASSVLLDVWHQAFVKVNQKP